MKKMVAMGLIVFSMSTTVFAHQDCSEVVETAIKAVLAAPGTVLGGSPDCIPTTEEVEAVKATSMGQGKYQVETNTQLACSPSYDVQVIEQSCMILSIQSTKEE